MNVYFQGHAHVVPLCLQAQWYDTIVYFHDPGIFIIHYPSSETTIYSDICKQNLLKLSKLLNRSTWSWLMPIKGDTSHHSWVQICSRATRSFFGMVRIYSSTTGPVPILEDGYSEIWIWRPLPFTTHEIGMLYYILTLHLGAYWKILTDHPASSGIVCGRKHEISAFRQHSFVMG